MIAYLCIMSLYFRKYQEPRQREALTHSLLFYQILGLASVRYST